MTFFFLDLLVYPLPLSAHIICYLYLIKLTLHETGRDNTL